MVTFGAWSNGNDIPYHHVPVTPENKPEAFAKVGEAGRLRGRCRGSCVTCRSFQRACERYAGRIINIHHSFYLICRR